MSSDGEANAGRVEWAPLIGEIVTDQDRGAFARLFKYSAPRVKVFMQRSDVTESGAEELAQETMLVVLAKGGAVRSVEHRGGRLDFQDRPKPAY